MTPILDTVAATAITALVSGVVGAIVGSLVSAAKSQAHRTVDEDRAMKAGMRALLWREVKDIHAEAIERGGMTVDERRHLENVYTAYHDMGGNGTGTRMFDEAMRTPIIES